MAIAASWHWPEPDHAHPVIQPLGFRPDFEQLPEDEAKTTEAWMAALRRILETTAEDEGSGLRAVHAKSHGLVTGEREPLPDLPSARAA